jgi:hypothetical protein
MVQPLSALPFLKLEVQLTGFAAVWQPASTVSSDALQAYFAKHGGEVRPGNRSVLNAESSAETLSSIDSLAIGLQRVQRRHAAVRRIRSQLPLSGRHAGQQAS